MAGRAEGNPNRYTAAKVNGARENERNVSGSLYCCCPGSAQGADSTRACSACSECARARGSGGTACTAGYGAVQLSENKLYLLKIRLFPPGSELTLGLATSVHSETVTSETQNCLGWKGPLRSSSPNVNSAPPSPPLNHVPRCHIYLSFKYLQ